MRSATEAGKRRCKRCAELLTPSAFYRNKNKKDGLESECKECCIERVRQYRIANKEKVYARIAKYRETYDTTTPERRAKASAAQQRYYRTKKALKASIDRRKVRVRADNEGYTQWH